MQFRIENLGPIKCADIDLNKKLTIFCGHNNTGKTYLSYLIYAIVSYKLNTKQGINKDQVLSLLSGDAVTIIINPTELWEYKKAMAQNIISECDSIFGISNDTVLTIFKNLKIDFSDTLEGCEKKLYDMEFVHQAQIGELKLKFEKTKLKNEVTITPFEKCDLPDENFLPFVPMLIRTAMFYYLATHPIYNTHIFPVERMSIYTFKTELSMSRNALIDQMQRLNKGEEMNVFEFLHKSSKRYPVAIKDGLEIANDLTNVQKHKSEYYELATEIEGLLLDGSMLSNKNGDVLYSSNRAGKSKKLPIHISASIVKSLSSLVFYLKHIAKKDSLIIIDEPEMNLHPNSQRILVHVLGKLINSGLRLLVSTHSDYIIREINNLIMANEAMARGIDISIYNYSPSILISKEDVNVYFFKYRSKKYVEINNVDVSSYGFAVESIDETIELQNRIAENLFYTLKYPEDEC